MKKFLPSLLCFFVFTTLVGFATAADLRTVLSTTTQNGVTTTVYVGRIQADPGKDGTITITVYPAVVLTDSTGAQVGDEKLDTTNSFPLVIPAQVKSTLAALVQAAYAADKAAKAAH